MKLAVSASLVLAASLLPLCGCHSAQPTASDLYNDHASLTGKLPYPVLTWHALNTSVDRTQLTTSTLFGNDTATTVARNGQANYPAGAMLGLVKWHQREDPHWFGARIPDEPASVEFVIFGQGQPTYRKFAGKPLVEEPSLVAAQRAVEIAAMKAIYLP